MSLVLGLDSSTQSLSAVVINAESGTILAEVSLNFGSDFPEYNLESGFIPGGENGEVHANPLVWLDALDGVLAKLRDKNVPMGEIVAISGSGQQHGSVYLKANFESCLENLAVDSLLSEQLAPSLARETSPIWMDTSTSEECAEITATLGGADEVCRRSGSIAIERFTGPQIRKFAKSDPVAWSETATVHLVSSFLASVLAGKSVAIDTGDGAGMNLMNLSSGDWDADLVNATAENLAKKLPNLAPASTIGGTIASYFSEKYGMNENCQIVLWSGDNPCSLVGMGASQPGKIVISLGTSDTLFAAMPQPLTDPRGYGHVFGNPLGGYMSLICFRNGSLSREAVKERFQLSWDDFDVSGLVEDEITPRLTSTGFTPIGWEEEPTADEFVRGILEGQFLNMKRHSDWLGVETEEILLTGGASENDGIAQIIANVFCKKVRRLAVSGSATLGAAMRAAVAMGANLAELEFAFSAPAEGADVEPQEDLRSCYILLEKIFADSLESRLNTAP